VKHIITKIENYNGGIQSLLDTFFLME